VTAPLLRIGTRGSALALAQARELQLRLAAAHAELRAPGAIETMTIRTTGDKVQDRPLAELGNKALFTKEIEDALIEGRVDLAVHSGKDLPTLLPPGLEIACCLPREDPRDALFARRAASLIELPAGARVGTSSPRRAAQLRYVRRDLHVVPLRGNVGTRLQKLDDSEVDAAVLAVAGVKRLGLEARIAAYLPLEDLLPAPAQGAIAVEIRENDERARRFLTPIDDAPTSICVAAERAFLAVLDGSCRTPIAALAEITGVALAFRGMIVKPDGTERLTAARHGIASEALALAADAARDLRSRAGPGFFESQA
jgi:hydroxymethylbilane synthase